MTPIIEITNGFVTSSLAYVAQIFSDVSPLLYLVVGLPVAFWIINKTIGLVRGRAR